MNPPHPKEIEQRQRREVTTREPEHTGAREREVLRVGRYVVSARIASGGMATVHLGRILGAAGFSRIVAIKRLLPQFAEDPEFETMFVEEAQLAARIHHPNVVPTLDVVAKDGELLLIMEYVQGESLARLVNLPRGQCPVARPVALAIVCDALHGLHAAHEARDRQGEPLGIIHRDVSPQNILVGIDGVARVIDFGIAKAATSLNTTQAGLVRGKLAYMAPEQIVGKPLSRRTDIYSAGVLLWELLVGERLFPGGTRPEVAQKIAGQIPRSRDKVPSIPERLDRIVGRALATEPHLRFPDARAMALAIEEVGTLASRSQVAAWVEQQAREALVKRAELIAIVEAAGNSERPALGVSEACASVAPDARLAVPAEVPSHPQTRTGPSVPSARTAPMVSGAVTIRPVASKRLALRHGTWVGAGVALATALAFTVHMLRATHEAKTAVQANSALQPTSSVQAATPPSPVVAPSTRAAVTPQPPAETVASAPDSNEPVKPPVVTRNLGQRSQRETVARAPRTTKGKDCNPPYTVDTNGHRHYKVECF